MDVVAFRRRDRIVLATPTSDGVGGAGAFEVVAEGGRRFRLDRRGVVARVAVEPGPRGGEDEAAWLLRLRAEAGPGPDWEAVHALTAPDEALELDELARRAGCAGGRAPLDWLLDVGAATAWFKRGDHGWRPKLRERALAEIARRRAAQRQLAEDTALLGWWPHSVQDAPPDDAAGALAALTAFALDGESPATERGRVLAARLELPEPDHVLEALVERGLVPADLDPSPRRAGLSAPFPEGAAGDVTEILTVGPDRLDLRCEQAVAVDDPATLEVDDALALRRAGDRRELLVHIADVASALPAGTALDLAARARSTSLYTPDGIVTMLPRSVVTEKLSLDAGQDRAAVTAIFTLSADGLPVAPPRMVRSLVRVTRALSYEQADDPEALLPGGAGAALLELGERLAAARLARGAVVVELQQAKVMLVDGRPHVGVRPQGTPSDRLVAETMIVCNAAAAAALAAAGRAALFRVQDPPRHALPGDESEHEDDAALRGLRTRRALSPGWLCAEARPHAGLALDAYAQATSPIRRYGDLVNQRLLLDLLDGREPTYSVEELTELALFLEERRRVVRAATQARESYWVARALLPLLGQRIEGTLVRAPRRGLGLVWTPLVHRELPLRVPRGFVAPPVGTTCEWTLALVRPWRGRMELEP